MYLLADCNVLINVISLRGSPRRDRFQTTEVFHFFDAVEIDGEAIFNKDIFKMVYGRDARNGEIGCTLSHYCIAHVHSTDLNHEWSLVLEDDAIFSEQELLSFVNGLPAIDKPTILVLGHSKTIKRNLFIQRLIYPLKDIIAINGKLFGHTGETRCGTVAYVANRSASMLIAKNQMTFWLADDWTLIENMGVDVLHFKKPLVYELMDGVSSTDNKIYINHDFLDAPFVIFYRVVKSLVKKLFFQ